MNTKQELIHALSIYTSKYEVEAAFSKRFLSLLENENAFQRTHLPGHITGSAWICNEDFSKVLLVHHAKLNRWLQPGGHADGDENIIQVALKETEEETGIKHYSILAESIFDLDIHRIPERKDMPAHDHYDIRILVQASDKQEIIVSEESHDLKWFALDEVKNLTDEQSVLRMVEKVTVMATKI
ncbi:MAG: NUDIX hydrolase [Chryseotalea sp.]|jgi:8-oxo-dGTP pyrophosphatase MutT (NUDIX family)